MIGTARKTDTHTCDACGPDTTCAAREKALLDAVSKSRLALQMAEAAARNADDAVRAHRRMHAPTVSKTKELLGDFDHTATIGADGKTRNGDLACMIGFRAFSVAFGRQSVELVHGSGAHATCKVYRLHTQA